MAVQRKLDLPLAPRTRAWDGSAAEKRVRRWAGGPNRDNVRWADYWRAFFWRKSDAIDRFTSYKLGYADVINGQLTAIPRGIFAVANILSGARGGVRIPPADQAAVKRVVDRWYAQMRKEFDDPSIRSPWSQEAGASGELLLYADGTLEFDAGDNSHTRLGTALYRRRQAMGLGMDEVAEALPVSKRVYQNIEGGIILQEVPDDVLEAIGAVLEFPIEELKGFMRLDIEHPISAAL